MGNFNREDKGSFRSGGRNGEREGGREFNRSNFQKKERSGYDSGNKAQMMHQATCSECGKRCEVPFRPVNGKPVYCADCFAGKRGASTGDHRGDRVSAKVHYENRNNRGSDDGVKRQLAEMNMKIDRLIKIMETLTGTGAKSAPTEVPKREEKKSVDVAELKKALDQATEKESEKMNVAAQEEKVVSKKPTKKAAVKKKK
jgi:CxxC-x17-CxxC domain-containing protein